MTDLILHIGTEKTGSTSIQYALASCRQELAARGILYPRLLGTPNHTEVAMISMGFQYDDPLQMQELARTGLSLPDYTTEVLRRLDDEIAQTDAQTVLLSNEHCHGRVLGREFVERLHAHFSPRFSSIRVIVYLRRQDRMVVSHHSTRLREGGEGQVFPQNGTESPFYNFERLLGFYGDLFGDQAITVRLFESDRLIANDIVHDFFETAGLGMAPPPHKIIANPSVSRQQSRFLTLFNTRFPLVVNGALNPERDLVVPAIEQTLKGPQARPARAEAQAFLSRFDAANTRLRDRFLPDLDRPTLFDTNFADYPEKSDLEVPLTEAEMLEFASALWRWKVAP
ncbi:hypothetical protein [Paracoccus pacificus]|uniref:Sulfotransferase domain-containing protein n=1 Tax=Paracoccus pacificus TaxID=1463598 RepID=A0ABW4R260_9RHOB